MGGVGEGGVVDVDAQAAFGIPDVAEGEVDLGFRAGGGVGEEVVAHGDGGIAVDGDLLVAEADLRPGLEGEAVVFGDDASDEVGDGLVEGGTEFHGGGQNRVAIEMVVARLHAILKAT